MSIRVALCVSVVVGACWSNGALAESPYQIGFGKADITPTSPLRLSGYGNRSEPSEGVDESLFVRAMAVQAGEDEKPFVIVSVDTIGVPGLLTKQIHQRISRDHDIPRFAVCVVLFTFAHSSSNHGGIDESLC